MKTEQRKHIYTLAARTLKTTLALGCLLAVALVQPTCAQTPAITTDHYSYLPGEAITALFQGGPGNPLDWVGIYPDGVVPGSVGSTIWLYTDGTTDGNTGLPEGSVTFTGGLSLAGDWDAYLLLNDGYTILAQTKFRVIDPFQTFVRPDKRTYTTGESISIAFTNDIGYPKDWIGVYPEDRLPGDGSSLIWAYVDGTQDGTTAFTEGVVSFPDGLDAAGNYVAYLLMDDGYTVLASEPFSVQEPPSGLPRLISITPADGSSNAPPFVEFGATIKNATRQVVADTVKLMLDDATAQYALDQQADTVTVSYTNKTALAPGSVHTFTLSFADDATPPNAYTNQATFTVANYVNIVLPSPLYFENFDSVDEGALPAGWSSTSYSDVPDANFDLQDLNSASYANWVVVSRDRFTNSFSSYDTHDLTDGYQQVLSVNPLNIVNGQPLGDLASGRFVFGDSGYRSGGNQYLILYTPDYDLSGKTNVYLFIPQPLGTEPGQHGICGVLDRSRPNVAAHPVYAEHPEYCDKRIRFNRRSCDVHCGPT